jgi:2-C-methyl-D-erythritol 4-phosphate cytidylyltransferase / 2-C-methyl-D-erythritol 2,4-cyclodiphosphate synthase
MQTKDAHIAAVICAAGSSKRMGGVKKEYLALPSLSKENSFSDLKSPLTVLGAAVSAFASLPQIRPIVITVPPGEESEARSRLPKELIENERVFFVSGGKTRRASVHNALLFLASHKPSHVLIHDGARPWIKPALIEKIIEGAIKYGAAIPALPLVETPKELNHANEKSNNFYHGGHGGTQSDESKDYGFIKRHLRRENICTVQTPQGFAFPEILAAHEKASEIEAKEGFEYTDDAEVWGEFEGQVAVISGDSENRKITYPEDLEAANGKTQAVTQRIGIGKDLHRLAGGRKFLLGGVEIPFDKGELGHSDGDVLAHAVCDAILGAAGLGDIGELFPDSDPAYKDADSMELLRRAWLRVKAQGWRLVNLDCVVCCEKPKVLPHRDKIRASLAEALDADPALVFVKGKTAEGLGSIGRGEAVEAVAVCLIET